MLNLKVEIEIQELPASELVSREIYDDKGNITGMLSDEDYAAQVEEMVGRAFFGIQVVIEGKAIRIRSNVTTGDPVIERNERANTLAQGLAQIGASIYKNFAP